MRTIVAGSRSINSFEIVEKAIQLSGFEISVLISGTARGVDRLGERWAEREGVPIERFFPDWDTHGMRAGPIRNQEMANHAEALIAVMEAGGTKGTEDMVRRAKAKKLRLFVYYLS